MLFWGTMLSFFLNSVLINCTWSYKNYSKFKLDYIKKGDEMNSARWQIWQNVWMKHCYRGHLSCPGEETILSWQLLLFHQRSQVWSQSCSTKPHGQIFFPLRHQKVVSVSLLKCQLVVYFFIPFTCSHKLTKRQQSLEVKEGIAGSVSL